MSHSTSDVLIIGAGAAGGVIAKRLASAGIGVVCLEQGRWWNASEFPGEDPGWELTFGSEWGLSPNVRSLPEDYPCDISDSEIDPAMFNAVGGSLLHYGGGWVRMRPADFVKRSLYGIADDWPIGYGDLVPYYEQLDREMSVAGLGGDPAFPSGQAPPLPPHPIGILGRKAAEGMNKLGWHWWPATMAIPSERYEGREPCQRLSTCMSGCPAGAKSVTDITHWPSAIGAGAQLVTGARVRELTVDAKGRATGAVYVDRDGREHLQQASLVILAANAIGNPRLLLLSRSAQFPDGLANSSGLVGKRLTVHPYVSVEGLYEEALDSQLGPPSRLFSLQFGETDLSRGFGGGAWWEAGSYGGPLTALGVREMISPGEIWGERHHELMADTFDKISTWGCAIEDLPNEENLVTLADDLVDSNGIAAPAVVYKVSEDTRANIKFQLDRMDEAHAAAGAHTTNRSQHLHTAWHLMGTARMGKDPRDSVVDGFGRSHDVPNLFVLGASAFVTSSPTPPTATLSAIALRAADHILETDAKGGRP